jgi:hypothetical protein
MISLVLFFRKPGVTVFHHYRQPVTWTKRLVNIQTFQDPQLTLKLNMQHTCQLPLFNLLLIVGEMKGWIKQQYGFIDAW